MAGEVPDAVAVVCRVLVWLSQDLCLMPSISQVKLTLKGTTVPHIIEGLKIVTFNYKISKPPEIWKKNDRDYM